MLRDAVVTREVPQGKNVDLASVITRITVAESGENLGLLWVRTGLTVIGHQRTNC